MAPCVGVVVVGGGGVVGGVGGVGGGVVGGGVVVVAKNSLYSCAVQVGVWLGLYCLRKLPRHRVRETLYFNSAYAGHCLLSLQLLYCPKC